jgi:hypothetical protein
LPLIPGDVGDADKKSSSKEVIVMTKSKRMIGGLFGVFFGCMSVSSAAAMSADLPKTKTHAGVAYLSGGVGVDEREALQRMSKGDNVQLIFAARDGEYLSDVNVTITNSEGHKVLEAVSQGPWFFMKLPAGKYSVTAETMGHSLQRVIEAPRTGRAQMLFSWDNSIVKTSRHPLVSRSAKPEGKNT